MVAKIDSTKTSKEVDDIVDIFTVDITRFDSTYSCLYFVLRPLVDAFKEVPDIMLFFLQQLSESYASQPRKFGPIIVEVLKGSNLGSFLESMMINVSLKIYQAFIAYLNIHSYDTLYFYILYICFIKIIQLILINQIKTYLDRSTRFGQIYWL